jgi:hypothetical protein
VYRAALEAHVSTNLFETDPGEADPTPPRRVGGTAREPKPGVRVDAATFEGSPRGRLGADWAAVLAASVVVLLATTGLLPAISFLVK